MSKHIISGWLMVRVTEDEEHVLYISKERHDYWEYQPLVEVVEEIVDLPCTASIQYYVANQEITIDEANEYFINSYYGNVNAEYMAWYSDVTGYLWTDEELKVGGHDLLAELKQWDEKYLILTIEVQDE